MTSPSLPLPDLVLMKVLCYCSQNIGDILSLRETSKQFCSFIDQNWCSIFNITLILSNVNRDTKPIVDISKPVLNLKLRVLRENYNEKEYDVVQVDSIAACENDDYYIYEDDLGKRLPLIIKPSEFTNISKLEKLLTDLNLNNLQSLDISFEAARNCFSYPYHVVLLNKHLKNRCLKKMKLDVNFLCGYCTEFVANIQDYFPNIELLEITNIVQRDQKSIDVMICLSLCIFEKFHRDSSVRKTLVKNIPLQCLASLDDCRDKWQFTFQVLPYSASSVALQFG